MSTGATFYAATTDLWSSKTVAPYMSYTVHYINNDWQLMTRHLQTMYTPEDHTGSILANGLKETLELWDLKEEFQVCVTTDNGSNIIKVMGVK
ncbi:hypothetical protein SNE40_000606 [Patella caerulea]|uniref:Uncharacterized protein n=1 Tax=Patella caerulea TaxID=87958 RepID=A0AAN8KAW0_PATCE